MQSYPGNHSEQEFVCRSFRNYNFFFLKIKKKKGQSKANPKNQLLQQAFFVRRNLKLLKWKSQKPARSKSRKRKISAVDDSFIYP